VKNFLIAVFSILFIYIVYTVIATSLESNLFKEWDFLASIPWMTATLIDFYINTVVIFVWMAFRENNWTSRILWLIGFVFLGSIATTLYVLIQLFSLKKDEPVINAFLLKKS
jgi:hypothetical protein